MKDIFEDSSQEIIKNQARYIESLSRSNAQLYSVIIFLIEKNGGSVEIPESDLHRKLPGKLETSYDPAKKAYISRIIK